MDSIERLKTAVKDYACSFEFRDRNFSIRYFASGRGEL